MELKEIITIAVTVLLAVGSWIAVHLFTSKRDMYQKKREFRVKYLRDAYITLANVSDRGSLEKNIHDIQNSFNDIQLFGEPKQIKLIGDFIDQAKKGISPSIDTLLKELRNEIREHIGLRPIHEDRWYIRIKPDMNNS